MSLTLPKKITLVQSTARERQIVAKLRANVEAFERKIADPIHVSDLLEPRKGYWQRITPKRFKDEAIMFFSMGYMGHDYLLGKFDSGSRTEGDLIWSPDGPTDSMLVPVDGSLVVEVKITTKRTVASTQSELEKYLKQVLAYMAKEKKTKAEIWIWYLGNPSYPRIVVFTVDVTEKDLKKYSKQMDKGVKELRMALTNKDHTVLPLCSREFCYRSKCAHYDDCKPEGRYKPKKEEEVTT